MNQSQFDRVFEQLTPRRKQVLKLLLAGVSDRAIAQSLHITPSTVRKHVENICLAFSLQQEFPDDRHSKRPELITLFTKYKPELVNSQLLENNPSQTNSSTAKSSHKTFPVTNRDVFILIDQSGSMVRKDSDTGKQTRYEYLAEVIEGHIAAILSPSEKISKIVQVLFFSAKKTQPQPIIIEDPTQVHQLFINNQPKTKTFITPTLEYCFNTWLLQGKPHKRGAFFLIYTDGLFDDEEKFIQDITSICTQITHHSEVKIFVLGLGKDLDIEHFLALDFNINKTMPHNIFVFDLVNEVDDIIELLSRQLNNSPHLALPNWVKTSYPEFSEKILMS
ncbi:MAG: LuxR C-terminal-related transcriptional regulator [Oscillatoria sp. PMC 1068.18]|nr:LuxR C-terminal-related transcriptional regulator [Oscillatoria sp. PMC 1076.18]MEC4990774.1 LuxR C-terminal-related transcriptional regulator [Oscillatoria sp. PMC 1068.18]